VCGVYGVCDVFTGDKEGEKEDEEERQKRKRSFETS
jgi:hypothetical protein